MNLDVYNSHMELYPYVKDDYPIIEDMYTAIDKFTQKEFPCGYIIEDGKLFLPRGTSISKIESLCKVRANYINDSDPIKKMSRKFYPIYDPRNKIQEESIEFLKGPEHQLGLNLKTGIGKAQPISTKIPTPNGYKLMGDLQVGDKIFGSDGKQITVLETFDQGVKDIYEIIFNDGRTAKCCKEHLWKVFHGKQDNWSVMSLENIMKDYKRYSFKKDDGYHDPHVYKYKIQTLSNPVDYDTTCKDAYNYGYMFGSNLKKTLGYNISLDDKYIHSSYGSRISLLNGIITTGCFGKFYMNDKLSISILSASDDTLNKLKELFLGMNLSTSVDWDRKYIYVDIPSNLNQLYKSDYLTIKDIRYSHREESRCILVDAKDHLYLTEDFIVTHNTFCVAYASTELNEKTMIITPNENLKHQWISTYNKMFDYRPKNLMNIAGSSIIDGLMLDEIEPSDVYFVNHQTLRSYMTSTNGYNLHKLFKKLNIGIKVYDESHMEFANILLIDFFTNTNRTWYLTATFDRSDKTESACFKRAFNSVITYGEIESSEIVEKHVVYHIVNVNSRISPKDRAKVIGFSGMSAASYGKYAFLSDENDTAYKAIVEILKKIRNVEGKILIFIPLIEAVDNVTKKLKNEFPDKDVAAFHSKISKEEKESAKNKDIIVSTIKSCGTGQDIPGLRCLICVEPIASKVVAEQIIGRLRPYGKNKLTYFFDIIDISIPPINYWWRARFKKIQTLVKEVIYLNINN